MMLATMDFLDLLLLRVLPLLLGGVSAFLAAATAFQSIRLVLRGTLAKGTVVGHQREQECYWPIVEFTDRNGSQRRFTSRSGRGKAPYRKGSRVTVVYEPANQNRAEIRAFWTLWLFPVVLSAFAALFLAVAFGVIGH